MGRGGNCSWIGPEIPLSSEMFSVIKDELWLFLIPAGLAAILLALFLEEVGFFLRRVPSSRRKHLYLWILGMYPVFALTSLIALYIPRSSSLCNFMASLYHSITLLKFMGLITDFFGGKARMLGVLSGEQVSPDPFPCCCCCCLPMVAINRSSLGWMMAAVLQLSVVRSILFFVTLVLWTDEQYDYGDVDSVNPNLYVNGIIGVSTFLSFYGHLLFYKATKMALPGYGLRAKFICIIVVLVLCGLQSGILETMGALEVIPCTPPFSVITRSQLIYHYCVIVEMFCIGLYARHTFRKVEPSVEEDMLGSGPLLEKAVQTEDDKTSHHKPSLPSEEPWPDRCFFSASNPSYNSDSEDSLCRIEHAPLDGFSFPQARGRDLGRTRTAVDPSPAEELGVHMSTVTVTADINYEASKDVTVV
ncbi:organic solute transporter subunit alpha [Myripristis murdjan]|uniref:organic solute transporter subunit alpha n=1 Tax=Myripristis murdjan TaxID=586833 RepID=UPI001175F9F5|nr:organic solute transporter subunit alpha-like [Myripristis murdjan]